MLTAKPVSVIVIDSDDAGTPKSCMTSLRELKRPPRNAFADITNILQSSAVHSTKVRCADKDKVKKIYFDSSSILDKENVKASTFQSSEVHTTKGRVKEKANFKIINDSEKGKTKVSNWEDAPLKDWSRNLFAEEFSTDKSTVCYMMRIWVRHVPQCLCNCNTCYIFSLYEYIGGFDLIFFCYYRGD